MEIAELLDENLAHFRGLLSTRWLPSRLRSLKAITVTHMENLTSSCSQDTKPASKAK